MQDLFNLGFVKKIPDIYLLKNHKEDLIELEGYGSKSVDNLLIAIENSKENSLERLLFGLGIGGIGDKTALLLARKYKTLEELSTKTKEELEAIKDIGPILAYNIVAYFNDPNNKEIINK